jgi:hypothetical protein
MAQRGSEEEEEEEAPFTIKVDKLDKDHTGFKFQTLFTITFVSAG